LSPKKAREEDVENFLRMARAFTQSRDRHNADAILQLSDEFKEVLMPEILPLVVK
jgi:hypothetical protein